MTAPINTDPPEPIEPSLETIAPPGISGPMLISISMDADGTPYPEYIPISEVPVGVLYEMAQGGSDAAAQELAWRFDNDPEFGDKGQSA